MEPHEDSRVGDESAVEDGDAGGVQQLDPGRPFDDGGGPPQALQPQFGARGVGAGADRAAQCDEVRGPSAREVVVVEHPHPHAGALGFLEHMFHDVEPALGEERGLHLGVVVREDDDLVHPLVAQFRELGVDQVVGDGAVPVPVDGGAAVAAGVGEGGGAEARGARCGDGGAEGGSAAEGGRRHRGDGDEVASGQVEFRHGRDRS